MLSKDRDQKMSNFLIVMFVDIVRLPNSTCSSLSLLCYRIRSKMNWNYLEAVIDMWSFGFVLKLRCYINFVIELDSRNKSG